MAWFYDVRRIMKTPLKIENDEAADIVTIEGMKYSGDLFRSFALGGIAVGVTFSIMNRDEGKLTIQSHSRSPRQERARAFEEAAATARSWKLGPRELAKAFESKAAIARRIP